MLFRFPTVWLNKLWELSSVSIAAQIFTLPLTFYYFHQFPTYFLLSNLLVIPLATLILYLVFVTLILGQIPLVGAFLFKVLQGLTYFLNWFVSAVNKMPNPIIDGIFIPGINVMILYVIIFSTFIYFSLKHKKMFLYGLSMILIFIGFQLASNSNKKGIYVYHLPGNSCLNYFDGQQSISVATLDSVFEVASFKIGAHQEFLNPKFTENILFDIEQNSEVYKRPGFMYLGGYTFFIPDELDKDQLHFMIPRVDYLYIKNNLDQMDEWENEIDFKSILVDASLNARDYKKLKIWVEEHEYTLLDAYQNSKKILIGI